MECSSESSAWLYYPEQLSAIEVSSAEGLYRRVRDSLGGLKFHERRFELAGHPVSLQATTEPLLERLYGAFRHLPACPGDPSLSIRIAECPCSGLPDAVTLEGGQTVGGHRFWISPDKRYFCHTLLASGSWYCIDRAASEIVGSVESVNRMSTFEQAKPVVRPLLLWLEQCRLMPVHAGMVSWRGKGILLGGHAGSGKSTASLSSLQAGLRMLAEDYTLLEQMADGTFTAHSLYNSAWVEADHLWRFPGLAERAIPGDEMANGKCILMLYETHPAQFLISAPVEYLVLPRVRAGGKTALYTASRADALKRCALESMVTLTRLGGAELDRLTRLVRSVDCYWLDLGVDLDQVGVLLKALVEQDPD
jgi:hypothetical protein